MSRQRGSHRRDIRHDIREDVDTLPDAALCEDELTVTAALAIEGRTDEALAILSTLRGVYNWSHETAARKLIEAISSTSGALEDLAVESFINWLTDRHIHRVPVSATR